MVIHQELRKQRRASIIARLIYYCTGKALKAIQCYAAINPDEGFYKAKYILKERFGNDFVIAEAWITKVTSGSRIRPSDREGLQEFSDDLYSCQETLTAMGRLTEIMNQQSLVNIVERLPIYLLNRWRREAHKITKRHGRTSFTGIVSFVKDAAEEANDPVYGRMTYIPSNDCGAPRVKWRLPNPQTSVRVHHRS